MRVVVIGGGAAGMSAARTLVLAGADVVLLESKAEIGGNCSAVEVMGRDGSRQLVDTGVTDFNRTTFSAMNELVGSLGLETESICTDVQLVSVNGRSLASCHDGRWRGRVGGVELAALEDEICRFRSLAPLVLGDAERRGWTLERYLDEQGFTRGFRDAYLYPRAGGCFPLPDVAPALMNVGAVVEFFHIHGLVGSRAADRRRIVGGMHRLPLRWRDWFLGRGGRLRCNTHVLGVVRNERNVEIHAVDAEGRRSRMIADHVVLANHASQALLLLDDSTLQERVVLSSFRRRWGQVVVHRWPGVAGLDSSRAGAFNYVVDDVPPLPVRPTITFRPDRIAHQKEGIPPVFVTLNPHLDPPADTVIARREFLHPILTPETPRQIAAVAKIQGRARTWYAGAYLQPPFVHESALQSGIAAARALLKHETMAKSVDSPGCVTLRRLDLDAGLA